MELLGLVENRDLTSQLLDANDNINNQLLRYERYNKNSPAPAASNVTSTDDVLLEVAAGPISQGMFYCLAGSEHKFPFLTATEEPILGAMALQPRKPKQDFQDVDLLGTDEPPSSEKRKEGISNT